MQMGISQIDIAILLPAFAAAWNLAGGQRPFAAQKVTGRTYRSMDGFYSIEAPSDWEFHQQEGSNEVTFHKGKVSVSVTTAETAAGDTAERFLEFNMSLLSQICLAAEVWAEGNTTVAGVPGAYFTMFCPGPRERTIVRVAAALLHGKFYIFKIAAPCAEWHETQSIIDRMAQSFKAGDGMPKGRDTNRLNYAIGY